MIVGYLISKTRVLRFNFISNTRVLRFNLINKTRVLRSHLYEIFSLPCNILGEYNTLNYVT